VGGGNVEQDDFVGALLGVAMSERGRVTGVDKVEELDAFDDAPVADVEAGYDAAGEQGGRLLLRFKSRSFASLRMTIFRY
jgi:hypothetical protein